MREQLLVELGELHMCSSVRVSARVLMLARVSTAGVTLFHPHTLCYDNHRCAGWPP